MDRLEGFAPFFCLGGPLDGPSGEGDGHKTIQVVQRVDHLKGGYKMESEAIADAKSGALPAEAAVLEVVDGPPVQGDVERNGRNLELYAELGACAYVERIMDSFVVIDAKLDGGADVKVADACIGEDEVIGAGYIITMCMGKEAEVEFQEAGTAAVLIGKFAAVTGADTDSPGLGGSDGRKCEHAEEDNK